MPRPYVRDASSTARQVVLRMLIRLSAPNPLTALYASSSRRRRITARPPDRLRHAARRRAAEHVARPQRRPDVDLQHVRFEQLGVLLVLLQRQLPQLLAPSTRSRSTRRPDHARAPRGTACPSSSGSRPCPSPAGSPRRCAASAPAGSCSCGTISARMFSVAFSVSCAVEQRLLVLLQVAVVGQRQALQRRQQRHQRRR